MLAGRYGSRGQRYFFVPHYLIPLVGEGKRQSSLAPANQLARSPRCRSNQEAVYYDSMNNPSIAAKRLHVPRRCYRSLLVSLGSPSAFGKMDHRGTVLCDNSMHEALKQTSSRESKSVGVQGRSSAHARSEARRRKVSVIRVLIVH